MTASDVVSLLVGLALSALIVAPLMYVVYLLGLRRIRKEFEEERD